MFPVGFSLVVEATRTQARSALPDAPVVDAPPARLHTARVTLAAALRAAAKRVEPDRPSRPAAPARQPCCQDSVSVAAAP